MDHIFPHDLSVSAKSSRLSGVRIAICGGGGIAAIELPRVGRELRRHGAQIRYVVTENCLRFIGKESLEWASAAEVVVQPTGFAEHICTDDALLVFPATADILGKIAGGICSDGVTTLVQSALGLGAPVVICTTMHESLAQSPIVQRNIQKLSKLKNVSFLSPRIEEGKQKAPAPEILALELTHIINRNKRFPAGKVPQVAVTYGGTRANLDPVRCISNLSTGKMGATLIEELYSQGLDVTGFEAAVSVSVPPLQNLTLHKAPEFQDFYKALSAVKKEQYAGIFHIAAVSDYLPEAASISKLESTQSDLKIHLKASPKMVDLPVLATIRFKVGCKLTTVPAAEGLEVAKSFLQKKNLDLVLWNQAQQSLQKIDGDHEGTAVYTENGVMREKALTGKTEIAVFLAQCFLNSLREK